MRRTLLRLAQLIAVATLVLAAGTACGGTGPTLAVAKLSRVVLQPKDLPGWDRFEADAGTRADTGFLGSPDRRGVWIARYRSGAGIVVSRVDLYRSAKAAHKVYDALQGRATSNTLRPLTLPPLGDERVGYATRSTVTLDSIFWRRANAIASLVVQGSRVSATALANREDALIRAALR